MSDEPLTTLDALVQQHRQYQVLDQQLGARPRPPKQIGEGAGLLDLRGGDLGRRAVQQHLPGQGLLRCFFGE
ncbi:hypothetical protein ACH4TE_23960 [Streptomyces sioyaensis]|uniref:hypothetical protein n=1 Tax=Streptomyces sioyaensis TaxID=67364 RepID=UPI0037B72116